MTTTKSVIHAVRKMRAKLKKSVKHAQLREEIEVMKQHLAFVKSIHQNELNDTKNAMKMNENNYEVQLQKLREENNHLIISISRVNLCPGCSTVDLSDPVFYGR